MRPVPMLLAVSLTVLAGCAPRGLLSGGPYDRSSAPTEGLRYYVGRDVITVDALVSQRRSNGWNVPALGSQNLLEQKCQLKPIETTWRGTTWSITTTPAPDFTRVYRLALAPSKASDQVLGVKVSEDGLLASLNYEARDQRAKVVGSVLKGAAGIAGAALGITSGWSAAESLQLRGQPEGGLVNPVKLTRGPEELCYLLGNPEAAQRQFLERIRFEEELREAREGRIANLSKASESANASALGIVAERDGLLMRREQLLADQVSAIRAVIDAAVRQYSASSRVISQDTTVRVVAHFDLAQVPDESVALGVPLTFSKLFGALEEYPDMRYVLQNSRLAFFVREQRSYRSPVGADAASIASNNVDDSISCRGVKEDKCTRIYYRERIPREILVYSAAGGEDSSEMRLIATQRVPLISSQDPTIHVAFRSRALGSGKLSLSFGSGGYIASLEQRTDGGLADATATLADALTSARQEFVAGVGGIREAQSSVVAIQSTARMARIQELRDRSALLEAQIALEGTTASRDLVAEKRQMEAELALLQTQQALATATTTAGSSGEMAELRAEIERLRVEVELLKLRREIAAHSAPADASTP